MKTKHITKTIGLISALSISSFALISCDGGGDESFSNTPESGTVSNIPTSLINKTIKMDFTDGASCVGEGTYTFVDFSTVRGSGAQVLDTTRWTYTTSSEDFDAFVELFYTNNSAEKLGLIFTSSTGGMFRYKGFGSNNGNLVELSNCTGTFTLEE